MAAPVDVKFLKSHEWARKDRDDVVFGVSEFAIEQLNHEIVYLELPSVGQQVKAGETFGVIEAVKAASDLYAPLSGKIIAVNDVAVNDPMVVAQDPFAEGWLVKIAPSAAGEWDALLSSEEYTKLIESGEAH
ncbi:glycine cleavage system protein H [candidate division BRC1 bacterium HGW-BRC1-1]|jgi:glycine cleavage system H protein|nr:MAG: glycine cleavage system protein H [candidate division BRC1 bacterium HGW-BRC1-1]